MMMSLIDRVKRILGRRSNGAPIPDSDAAADQTVQPNPEARLGLSAQETIDASRQRTRAFVRDAAVELDQAPDDLPADAQPPASDRSGDDAPGDAKQERFQE